VARGVKSDFLTNVTRFHDIQCESNFFRDFLGFFFIPGGTDYGSCFTKPTRMSDKVNTQEKKVNKTAFVVHLCGPTSRVDKF
jgi:hypothetical protein